MPSLNCVVQSLLMHVLHMVDRILQHLNLTLIVDSHRQSLHLRVGAPRRPFVAFCDDGKLVDIVFVELRVFTSLFQLPIKVAVERSKFLLCHRTLSVFG